MTAGKLNLGAIVRLAVLESLLVFLGMLFVHKELWQLKSTAIHINHWQEYALLGLAALDGAISGFAGAGRNRDELARRTYGVWLSLGLPFFLVLYVACAALCQRIHVCQWDFEWVRTLAVGILAVSIYIRLWAARNMTADPELLNDKPPTGGPYKWLRHPDWAGRLLFLAAVPLVFASWLPLLILPGVFVLLKWHIADQEAFRTSQLGTSYIDYRKGTWNLIPYIY